MKNLSKKINQKKTNIETLKSRSLKSIERRYLHCKKQKKNNSLTEKVSDLNKNNLKHTIFKNKLHLLINQNSSELSFKKKSYDLINQNRHIKSDELYNKRPNFKTKKISKNLISHHGKLMSSQSLNDGKLINTLVQMVKDNKQNEDSEYYQKSSNMSFLSNNNIKKFDKLDISYLLCLNNFDQNANIEQIKKGFDTYLSSLQRIQNQILQIPKVKYDLNKIDSLNHKTKFQKIFTNSDEKNIYCQQLDTIDLDNINFEKINLNPRSNNFINLIFLEEYFNSDDRSKLFVIFNFKKNLIHLK